MKPLKNDNRTTFSPDYLTYKHSRSSLLPRIDRECFMSLETNNFDCSDNASTPPVGGVWLMAMMMLFLLYLTNNRWLWAWCLFMLPSHRSQMPLDNRLSVGQLEQKSLRKMKINLISILPPWAICAMATMSYNSQLASFSGRKQNCLFVSCVSASIRQRNWCYFCGSDAMIIFSLDPKCAWDTEKAFSTYKKNP